MTRTLLSCLTIHRAFSFSKSLFSEDDYKLPSQPAWNENQIVRVSQIGLSSQDSDQDDRVSTIFDLQLCCKQLLQTACIPAT